MDTEKSKYSIQPIMAIQQPISGLKYELPSGYQCLLEELKNAKEKILKLEIQQKAANETIRQQEEQLVKAKSILSEIDKLEGNSKNSVEKLKEELENERLGRIAAEEKVQQLGAQVERLKESGGNSMEHNEENIVDNFHTHFMEIDNISSNSMNNVDEPEDSDEVYCSSVIIGDTVFNNSAEKDELNCDPSNSADNFQFKTELQIIESDLSRYINKLVSKEQKPHKRQKCLNKVIQQTEKLVSSLSIMVSEEWLTYRLESHSQSCQSPSLSPMPSSQPLFLYSPIQLCEETSTESMSPSPPKLQPVNLPSCSKASQIPEEKSFTEKSTVQNEMDSNNNNEEFSFGRLPSTSRETLVKSDNFKVREKVFKCEMCDNRSRDTSALNLHYQRAHNIKTDYVNGCGKCGKIFATKGNLRKHSLSHRNQSKNVLIDISTIKIRGHQ